jgi:hypothetical protein
MTQNVQKMKTTLDMDYKGIDKLFKEQLIKTKVCRLSRTHSTHYSQILMCKTGQRVCE